MVCMAISIIHWIIDRQCGFWGANNQAVRRERSAAELPSTCGALYTVHRAGIALCAGAAPERPNIAMSNSGPRKMSASGSVEIKRTI
ncbi:MAG: hypothetical protein ACI9ZT_000414 [Gammaproteobacteria bacterium]|jgi:hypothetical protein